MSLLLCLYILVIILVWMYASLKVRYQHLKDNQKLTDIKNKEKTIIPPVWAKVQKYISKYLHHPNPRFQETDVFIGKVRSINLRYQ